MDNFIIQTIESPIIHCYGRSTRPQRYVLTLKRRSVMLS